ncbi:MAG: 2-C-methyl-D-erythritol 4-phosphate cytidylyltransferase [Oscillospiraceae bacterium]|jgi:2-C-methyl-D-erythritol 4-phosphate cytidylyltransferase
MAFHSAEKCCAVIAAAGQSTRMGSGISKQFLTILGMPAIVWTLKAFDEATTVKHVVVVCREEDIEYMKKCIVRYHIKKVTAVIPGGSSRQESVSAGVRQLEPDTDIIAIHDGARPLVKPEEIDACVQDAVRTGASALGVPLKDTIKKIDSAQCVLSTPKRESLWAVQTPQVFRLKLYRSALEKAQTEGKDYTDDCQLVEQLGVRVHLCKGSYENIKLTTAEDLVIAQAILEQRRKTR